MIQHTKEVKKVFPQAEHVSFGFGGVKIHSIYKNNQSWDKANLLGQSSSSKKHAWILAYEYIQSLGLTPTK